MNRYTATLLPPAQNGQRSFPKLPPFFLSPPLSSLKTNSSFRLIAPTFQPPPEHAREFERYVGYIEAEIEKILPRDIVQDLQVSNPAHISQKATLYLDTILPLFSATAPTTAPSVLYASLLCSSDWTHGVGRYLSDTLSRWLIPGKLSPIFSVQSLNFQFATYPQHGFFFHQIVISVQDERDLPLIKANLEHLTAVLRLNILAVKHARNVMSLSKLTSQQKRVMIQENITSLLDRSPKDFDHNVFDQMHHFLIKLAAEENVAKIKDTFAPILERRPKIFDRDIFNEIQHFVYLFEENFVAVREIRYITRIISFQYLLRKSIETALEQAPLERHLRVKLTKTHLQYPTEIKPVVGVLVGINVLRDTELFEEKHLFEAIQHCIPGVRIIKDSFIFDRRGNDPVRLLYLEVTKDEKSSFSLKELKKLREQLPRELIERIENVLHPVFMPRNEEEVMRNIVILSGQLKFVHDIPQVIISFDTQTEQELSFTIILLRILRGDDTSLQQLFQDHRSFLKLDELEVKQVGLLRKKYQKEANVFTVNLDKKPFLRKDYSLDLFKARGIVSTELSRILGEIRDFNGGIFSKQHEVLHELRLSLEQNYDFLLENFFYSIAPPIMQSILLPSLLRSLFLMFLEAVEYNFKKERIFLRSTTQREYLLLLVAAPSPSFKEKTFEAVSALKIPSLDLAYSFVEIYGVACLGYIYRNEDDAQRADFCAAIESAVEASYDP